MKELGGFSSEKGDGQRTGLRKNSQQPLCLLNLHHDYSIFLKDTLKNSNPCLAMDCFCAECYIT